MTKACSYLRPLLAIRRTVSFPPLSVVTTAAITFASAAAMSFLTRVRRERPNSR